MLTNLKFLKYMRFESAIAKHVEALNTISLHRTNLEEKLWFTSNDGLIIEQPVLHSCIYETTEVRINNVNLQKDQFSFHCSIPYSLQIPSFFQDFEITFCLVCNFQQF